MDAISSAPANSQMATSLRDRSDGLDVMGT